MATRFSVPSTLRSTCLVAVISEWDDAGRHRGGVDTCTDAAGGDVARATVTAESGVVYDASLETGGGASLRSVGANGREQIFELRRRHADRGVSRSVIQPDLAGLRVVYKPAREHRVGYVALALVRGGRP